MKISINTFYQELHVGAVLQAYALSRVLEGMGHAPEILRYMRPSCGVPARRCRQRVISWVTRERRRVRQYGAFRAKYLRESPAAYESYDRIVAHPPQADVLICGSDQIWNPELLAGNCYDPAYFLQYGSADIPRISYAASCGGHIASTEEEQLLKRYLAGFRAISVRESSSKETLERILGREVTVTLDPTLLLKDYSHLLSPNSRQESYVLLYAVQHTAEIRKAARDVAMHLQLPIFSAGGPLYPWKVVGRRVEVHGPVEWINLIYNAAAVVTNSFHGLAFSLTLGKRVIVSPLTGTMAARNDRLHQLCRALGIVETVIAGSTTDVVPRDINWTLVNARLDAGREASLAFLREALGC